MAKLYSATLWACLLTLCAGVAHAGDLEMFSSMVVCAPITVFTVTTNASSPSIVFSGDQTAISQVNVTVASGILSLTWIGNATVTTTQPLIANVSIPTAASNAMSINVANSPAQVLLAPNMSASCLSLSASNGGAIIGNLSSPVSTVSISATNNGMVALGNVGSVSLTASNGADVLLINVTGTVAGTFSNAANVAILPAPASAISVSGTAANAAIIYCPGCTANVVAANGATVVTDAAVAPPIFGTVPTLSCWNFKQPEQGSFSQCTIGSSASNLCLSAAATGAGGRKMLQTTFADTIVSAVQNAATSVQQAVGGGGNVAVNVANGVSETSSGSNGIIVTSNSGGGFEYVACKNGSMQAVF